MIGFVHLVMWKDQNGNKGVESVFLDLEDAKSQAAWKTKYHPDNWYRYWVKSFPITTSIEDMAEHQKQRELAEQKALAEKLPAEK